MTESVLGSGTTLLTCKRIKNKCGSIYILPFSVFLSNVKIVDYDVRNLEWQLNNFGDMIKETGKFKKTSLPDIPLVNKAFSPEVKETLMENKVYNR